MYTKKFLLTLLVFFTRAVAEPIKLPIIKNEKNQLINVSGLTSAIQLLYNITDLRDAIRATTIKKPLFIKRISRLFTRPLEKPLQPITLGRYNIVIEAAKEQYAPNKENDPRTIIPDILGKSLTQEQLNHFFSFTHTAPEKVKASPATILSTSYTLLSTTYSLLSTYLSGNYISNQSRYLLITIQDLATTQIKVPVDIFNCKDNELIGLIILKYKQDKTQSEVKWISEDEYNTIIKIDNNKWINFKYGYANYKNDHKFETENVTNEQVQHLSSRPINNFYYFPVILVYKKIDVEDLTIFPDFVKALARI